MALQPNEVSPVITMANQGTGNTIQAHLSPENATYSVEADFKSLVRLEGAGAYTVTGVEMKNAILEITYTVSGVAPTGLTILGKEGPASPSLFNANGIGIVSMKSLSIEKALPLFFNYFKLEAFSDIQELKWEISENDLFESFEILQSNDGRIWESLKIMPAKLGQVEKYTCIIAGDATYAKYFRILAIKKNGNTIYSNILSINSSRLSKNWNIYPNPIDVNSVIAYWSDINDQINLKLISLDGKNLSTSLFYVSKGLNTIPMNLPLGLTKGLYLLRLESTQGISYRRVIY